MAGGTKKATSSAQSDAVSKETFKPRLYALGEQLSHYSVGRARPEDYRPKFRQTIRDLMLTGANERAQCLVGRDVFRILEGIQKLTTSSRCRETFCWYALRDIALSQRHQLGKGMIWEARDYYFYELMFKPEVFALLFKGLTLKSNNSEVNIFNGLHQNAYSSCRIEGWFAPFSLFFESAMVKDANDLEKFILIFRHLTLEDDTLFGTIENLLKRESGNERRKNRVSPECKKFIKNVLANKINLTEEYHKVIKDELPEFYYGDLVERLAACEDNAEFNEQKKFFLKAIGSDDRPVAKFHLAEYYRKCPGRAISKPMTEAYKTHCKIEKEYAPAAHMAGRFALAGDGMTKASVGKAEEHFLKAASQGFQLGFEELLLMADNYVAQKECSKAEALIDLLLDAALKNEMNDIVLDVCDLRVALAKIYIEKKEHETAVKLLSKTVDHYPSVRGKGNNNVLLYLTELADENIPESILFLLQYFKKNNDPKVLTYYEKAIEHQDPKGKVEYLRFLLERNSTREGIPADAVKWCKEAGAVEELIKLMNFYEDSEAEKLLKEFLLNSEHANKTAIALVASVREELKHKRYDSAEEWLGYLQQEGVEVGANAQAKIDLLQADFYILKPQDSEEKDSQVNKEQEAKENCTKAADLYHKVLNQEADSECHQAAKNQLALLFFNRLIDKETAKIYKFYQIAGRALISAVENGYRMDINLLLHHVQHEHLEESAIPTLALLIYHHIPAADEEQREALLEVLKGWLSYAKEDLELYLSVVHGLSALEGEVLEKTHQQLRETRKAGGVIDSVYTALGNLSSSKQDNPSQIKEKYGASIDLLRKKMSSDNPCIRDTARIYWGLLRVQGKVPTPLLETKELFSTPPLEQFINPSSRFLFDAASPQALIALADHYGELAKKPSLDKKKALEQASTWYFRAAQRCYEDTLHNKTVKEQTPRLYYLANRYANRKFTKVLDLVVSDERYSIDCRVQVCLYLTMLTGNGNLLYDAQNLYREEDGTKDTALADMIISLVESSDVAFEDKCLLLEEATDIGFAGKETLKDRLQKLKDSQQSTWQSLSKLLKSNKTARAIDTTPSAPPKENLYPNPGSTHGAPSAPLLKWTMPNKKEDAGESSGSNTARGKNTEASADTHNKYSPALLYYLKGFKDKTPYCERFADLKQQIGTIEDEEQKETLTKQLKEFGKRYETLINIDLEIMNRPVLLNGYYYDFDGLDQLAEHAEKNGDGQFRVPLVDKSGNSDPVYTRAHIGLPPCTPDDYIGDLEKRLDTLEEAMKKAVPQRVLQP